ncbi:hypothetical protein GCM10025857_32820 [Alicyclobacillus contaminans]|uniref:ABC transporter permease subunit n=1 Tax=Alicyclobacillus contaminans TaxID=392016 RepID=UPI00041B0F36|nr:ABC transporter permease subunit [Alicyclobacillus contaminans]GMA51925.1 hypothetical protein GCM10025857_32820 [Alicyclobacillus contaminans]
MTGQRVFWALVRHDMKERKQRGKYNLRIWRWVYLAIIVAVAIAVTTYLVLRRPGFDGRFVWFYTFAIPFVCAGMGTGLVAQEFRNGTAGWWLTLPYPRGRLLVSKFVACIVRALIIMVGLDALFCLLYLYTVLLQGQFTASGLADFLLTGARLNLVVLGILPFTGSVGVTYGMLRYSTLRPLVPLGWGLFGILWWFLFSNDQQFIFVHPELGGGLVAVSPWLLLPMAVGWVLAAFLLRLATRIMEKHLTL